MRLPGIGEVTANRIIEARPFKVVKDLRGGEGVGEKALARVGPGWQRAGCGRGGMVKGGLPA